MRIALSLIIMAVLLGALSSCGSSSVSYYEMIQHATTEHTLAEVTERFGPPDEPPKMNRRRDEFKIAYYDVTYDLTEVFSSAEEMRKNGGEDFVEYTKNRNAPYRPGWEGKKMFVYMFFHANDTVREGAPQSEWVVAGPVLCYPMTDKFGPSGSPPDDSE